MRDDGMRAYRRLMRWYPASWRVQHEEYMLETLRETLESPSGLFPHYGEKWSIRLYGLGERLSLALASQLAVTALAVFAIAGVQRIALPPADIWSWLIPTLSVAVGPILLSVAASALLRSTGVFSSPAAVGVSAAATVAWSLALLTALSWSAGFTEADAGVERTWFGDSFLALFLVSCLVGMVALAPVWASLMTSIHPLWARWSLTAGAAALSVLPVGLSAIAPAPGLIVSLSLLIVIKTLRLGMRGPSPSPPVTSFRLDRRTRFGIAGSAVLGGLLGVLCVAFALTGSMWGSLSLDGTRAMNIGLAAGSLAAIPVAVAGGVALTRRHGARFWAPTWALVAALVIEAVGQFAGAGHPLQWPLMIAAAMLLGFGTAVLPSKLLPGGRIARSIAMVGISVVVAVSVGIYAATLLPFLAPVVAIFVVVWTIRGGRQPAFEPTATAGLTP